MMQIADTLAALAHLPDEALVTISVRKGDLVSALEMQAGGPEILDCAQAAAVFGFLPARWRRWAAEGAIEGAFKESEKGSWRLPRVGCEAHIRGLKRRSSSARAQRPSTRRVPRVRGPWKATTAAQTEAATAHAE